MSITLFDNSNLTITHNKEDGYLYLKWHGFLNSEDFRKAGYEIIQAIGKTGVNAILSDNTDWKTISPNDHGWAANNWFPQAEDRGIRKLATILSNDYFNRLAERSIEQMADVHCMEIRNFRTTQDAQQWLTKRPAAADCN